MQNELYPMLYKRKSIRRFDAADSLTADDLARIGQMIPRLTPLAPEISVRFEVIKREDTTAKRGEYCLLLYSEPKPRYLLNAGYLLEQMDLFFASQGIGACWYGLAKPVLQQDDGHSFVILLAFGKSRPEAFRTGAEQFRRKCIAEIWQGDFDPDVKAVVRLAPSACNTQPWRFVSSGNKISVFLATGFKSFIPASKQPYYHTIDLGIALFYLETALAEKGMRFVRALAQEGCAESGLVPIAEYHLS